LSEYFLMIEVRNLVFSQPDGLQLNAGGEFSAQSSTNVQMLIEEKKFNSPTSAPLAF
jgi:hypothetical protein